MTKLRKAVKLGYEARNTVVRCLKLGANKSLPSQGILRNELQPDITFLPNPAQGRLLCHNWREKG
jgi:hypothetical protein